MRIEWHALVLSEIEALGLEPSIAEDGRLALYLTLLDHWNQKINLTNLEPRERVRRLVAEPLWVGSQLRPAGHYIDIGSGNGSPGVPWALSFGFASSALVESRARRAVFLQVVARKLELERGPAGLVVHAMRFEAALPHLPSPNWVTLQGVRLDAVLLQRIRSLDSDVRVVWFTRNPALPESAAVRLRIPDSDREALVFGRAPGH